MSLYKTFSNFQEESRNNTISASNDFIIDEKDNFEEIFIDSNISESIEEQLSLFLYGSPKVTIEIIPSLIELISSNSDYFFHCIQPDHIQKIISYISTKEAINFLEMILELYPSISHSDAFFNFLDNLYDNIAIFFSTIQLDEIIKKLQNIIFNSIYDEETRDKFIKSKCMIEIEKHITNYDESEYDQDELLVISLEIMYKLIKVHPDSNMIFEKYILDFLEISTFDNNESVLSLKILIKLAKHNVIDLSKHITEYHGIDTTYISELVSFLEDHNILEKRIASFQLLSALSNYGDSMLDKMMDQYTLFYAKRALNDKQDKIIIEALKLFLNWYKNADKKRFLLYQEICSFNFIDFCANQEYQVKYHLMNLMMNIAADDDVHDYHLVKLISDELLEIIIEQLDEDQQEFSQKVLDFMNCVVIKCHSYPDFLQMISDGINELEFDNPLLNEILQSIIAKLNIYV